MHQRTLYTQNKQLPNMEGTTDRTANLSSDLPLWDLKEPLNFTLANSSADPIGLADMPALVNKFINMAIIVILLITMVSLGCTMEISKIKAHVLKPKGVAIAVVAQYGVMPLTAFCLAKLLQLGTMEAVTVLVCGCCPGGNLSNILALALKGDMNLSIVMTTCSTVLAMGMMPLLLYLYCQGFPGLENAVPYTGIIISLVMTLLPCAVGIWIAYRSPHYAQIITKVGMGILVVASIVLAILVGISFGGAIVRVTTPRLMATAALMPLIGYTLGYVLALFFKLNGPSRRTVAMETGCQNLQLCSTILRVAFPPEAIGPLFLFPFVYIFFQVSEALVFIILFRCHERITASKLVL